MEQINDIIVLSRKEYKGNSYVLGVWPKKVNKTKDLYFFGAEGNLKNVILSKNCGTLKQVTERLDEIILPRMKMQMFIEPSDMTTWYQECREILSWIKEPI